MKKKKNNTKTLQQTHSTLSAVEEEMPSLTNLNCKIISHPQEQLVFSHH